MMAAATKIKVISGIPNPNIIFVYCFNFLLIRPLNKFSSKKTPRKVSRPHHTTHPRPHNIGFSGVEASDTMGFWNLPASTAPPR
jgi:hypothetical protein